MQRHRMSSGMKPRHDTVTKGGDVVRADLLHSTPIALLATSPQTLRPLFGVPAVAPSRTPHLVITGLATLPHQRRLPGGIVRIGYETLARAKSLGD
jgi:hypothetical protein